MAQTRTRMYTATVKREIRRNAQPRMTIAADALRDALAEALDSGALPIQSDTGALSLSLSVQTPQGSDSDARIRRAATAYLSNPSRWMQPVREHVTPFAYEKDHFSNRVAPEEPLPAMNGFPRAKVYTRLTYGYWWYAGHNNVLTGRYEQRDWITPFSYSWLGANLAQHFQALI